MTQTYKTQISIREAIDIVRGHAPVMPVEWVRLEQAYHRTLAQDLSSKVDHPSCDNSALDGFACREADTLTASAREPVRLKVVGEVPAGSRFEGKVEQGQAVAIYTGAPVPQGADAIVAVEDSENADGDVLIKRPARPQDIRYRAQDIAAGDVILRAGLSLNAASVGVAASMGYRELPVYKRPRIGILSTGDEVIEPGEAIRDGQVYNSNSFSVAGLVERSGGEAVILPRAIDDPETLRNSIEAVDGLDLLVTSGGVSMGNYDFVRDLAFNEGEVHFWKVAVRPGGPALFASWGDLPIFGLPGNPVSSMVVYYLVTSAFVHAALNSSEPLNYDRRYRAKAASDFKGAGFKEAFRRASLAFNMESAQFEVASTGNQSSGILTSMIKGECLTVVPAHQDVAAGEFLDVIPL